VAAELKGLLRGERKAFAYDARFPEEDPANAFLPQIWARRKIGYLLDQIRLHGQTEELKEEVVRLSTEYGIATPYTSYLVLEDEEAYRRHGIVRERALGRLQAEGMSFQAAPAAPGEMREREAMRDELAQQRTMLGSGAVPAADAITLSKAVRDWREADAVGAGGRAGAEGTLRRAAGRRFVVLGGTYVDARFTEEMEVLKVKWGSDAYFNVLDALPELRPCLALGERVVVVVEGKALLVGDEGAEQMDAEAIREFFGK
jgi:Ca-activated chloride channel family protein